MSVLSGQLYEAIMVKQTHTFCYILIFLTNKYRHGFLGTKSISIAVFVINCAEMGMDERIF